MSTENLHDFLASLPDDLGPQTAEEAVEAVQAVRATAPQPMTLEETKDLLMQLRNEAVRERDSNAKKRDMALSSLEKALYGEGFAGWDEHVRILDSTLHHLEAGKRAQDERMDLAMAYAEGFKDGCHCYSEDPSPERYLDGNWNDSNTKKIWSAALSPTQDQA